MKKLITTAAIVCAIIAFFGQNAEGQTYYWYGPPTTIIYETPVVTYPPVTYIDYGTCIVPRCYDSHGWTSSTQAPIYREPVQKRAPKIKATTEITEVKGYSRTEVRKTPKPSCQQSRPRRVTVHTSSSGGTNQSTTHYWEEVQTYDVEVETTILTTGEVSKRTYNEVATYRNGELYEIYWAGYDTKSNGTQTQWHQKKRWENGREVNVIPFTKLQPPTLAPPYQTLPQNNTPAPDPQASNKDRTT